MLTWYIYLYLFEINGHLVLVQKYAHMNKIVKSLIYLFLPVVNIVCNNDNILKFCNVSKLQSNMNASCHHASCYVIIMNVMVHLY